MLYFTGAKEYQPFFIIIELSVYSITFRNYAMQFQYLFMLHQYLFVNEQLLVHQCYTLLIVYDWYVKFLGNLLLSVNNVLKGVSMRVFFFFLSQFDLNLLLWRLNWKIGLFFWLNIHLLVAAVKVSNYCQLFVWQ